MANFCDLTFNEKDLVGALKEFGDDVSIKLVRGSLRRIAKEEMQALQDAAPVGDPAKDKHAGRLHDNITYGTAFAIGRGIVKAFVRVRTMGNKDNEKNAFYWRWVEFGHKSRSGSFVPGIGFIAAAIDKAQEYIARQFFGDLSAGIEKTYTRINR